MWAASTVSDIASTMDGFPIARMNATQASKRQKFSITIAATKAAQTALRSYARARRYRTAVVHTIGLCSKSLCVTELARPVVERLPAGQTVEFPNRYELEEGEGAIWRELERLNLVILFTMANCA